MPRLASLALCCLFLTTAVALASPKASHDARRSTGASAPGASAAKGATRLFGDKAVEHGRSRSGAGRAQAFPFRSSINGHASSISIYVAAHNKSRRLIAGLYTNSGGRPGKRLVSGTL